MQNISEYIINENWREGNGNIFIERMKVKTDSSFSIFDSKFRKYNPNHWNIVRKLKLDSSYRYSYNTGSSYNSFKSPFLLPDKKLYFNKFNGGYWGFNMFSRDSIKIIGNLENNTWYKFSHLKSKPYIIYTYVDSIGNTHNFAQDLSNM